MTEPWEDLGGRPAPKPGPPPKRIARAPQIGGCQHTEDPNGWLMDSTGRITGKCECWEVGE